MIDLGDALSRTERLDEALVAPALVERARTAHLGRDAVFRREVSQSSIPPHVAAAIRDAEVRPESAGDGALRAPVVVVP
jgi:hypothetical protein